MKKRYFYIKTIYGNEYIMKQNKIRSVCVAALVIDSSKSIPMRIGDFGPSIKNCFDLSRYRNMYVVISELDTKENICMQYPEVFI